MSEAVLLQREAMDVLKQTSRTFFIPINFLEPKLRKTVASAYLCMRAIDEIEDHPDMLAGTKSHLLSSISESMKTTFDPEKYRSLIHPYKDLLPVVTQRLGDWLLLCPPDVVEKVKESTAIMAEGMAKWVEKDWRIKTKEDLDDYTYYVAGLVGCMLSDIWKWHDNTDTDREKAVAFGRGLQAVNILRNQDEDWERGVRFLPDGWEREDLFAYAKQNLALGNEYVKDINNRGITMFCKVPLALANSTLKAMKIGREKISRKEVESIVSELESQHQ
ncbi:squalene/phytoene synthase family protein [Paenisporosarcina indica]|uniref:squalene/phytoene synthase family protein n=1 Tax=Paenisporosarcina indica TaxID=650093 RepID=UPI00094FF2FD|nr:phytoene/squalene synthase family protein [Paenisporosarcina indica]